MDSEFRNKPRSDPDKWKPLLGLVIPLLLIGPLAFIEYMLVREILHTGSLSGLIEAIVYGLLLIFLAYALVAGIYRWVNQPAPEELAGYAQAVLTRELPPSFYTVRNKVTKPPLAAIYAALPAVFLLLAVYLAWTGWLPGFFILLGFGVFFGGLMTCVYRQEKQRRRQVLTFDPIRRVIIFENFSWSASFLPQKPAARKEISFDQLLGTVYYPPGRGSASLTIRTTNGSITLIDELQEFERVHAIVDSLVLLNKADRNTYQQKLDAEPAIETPWYGWLILIAVVVAVALLGWKLLYADGAGSF